VAVILGYSKLGKLNYYKKLFKNPFWMYLMAIATIFFVAASNALMYIMAAAFLLLSIMIIIVAYFEKEFHLHNRVLKVFTKLEDEFVILPAMKLSDGYENSCTCFIVISAKGIFNIKVLEFSGILAGSEADEMWKYTDATNAYNIEERQIKNPITYLRKSHKVIEGLLKNNHIDYMFLKSIAVVNNSNAMIRSDTDIPIVKLNELNQYLHGHVERQHQHLLKETIVEAIMGGHNGRSCLKLYCPDC